MKLILVIVLIVMTFCTVLGQAGADGERVAVIEQQVRDLKSKGWETKDWVAIIAVLLSLSTLISNWLQYRRNEKRAGAAERRAEEAEQRAMNAEAAAALQAKRAEQKAMIQALQGEKESVAYMAFQLKRKRFEVSEEFRHDFIASLCLAYILEGSDRASALVLGTLKEFPDEVSGILGEIKVLFNGYVDTAFATEPKKGQEAIKRGQTRLDQLEKAFSGKGVSMDETERSLIEPPNEG